jgi:hypothetical protein
MKPLKTLALKKDTLTELGTDELSAVVGGLPTGLSVTTQDTSTLVLCDNTGYYLTLPLDGCIRP